MRGYGPPSVTQFSVFLDNRVGRLYDLMEALDTSDTRVCALNVHEASDHAVVRMITNNSAEARTLLKKASVPFAETDVIVVELSKGHSMTSLCLHLLAAELNIRFAYPLMLRPNGTPTIALSVDDLTLAGQILRRKEYRLFGEFDLPKTA
jgi:hypothetical protein